METMSSGSGSSSKRARAPSSSSASQVASCLVDGCNSDLSKCRDYHRRHKVCELHSKTPKVTIAGQEQRFCQQCSRFHSLGEFDEGKRSCRKRLEGHNRRRRKPQPESLSNAGNFLSGGQGGRFMGFSGQSQAIITPTTVVSSSWSGPLKTETTADSSLYSQAFCRSGGGGRQFPFLQEEGSGSSSSSNSNAKFFCNGLSQVINDSTTDHRALSLLSSSPGAAPETHEMRGGLGLSHMNMMQHPMAPVRPLFPSRLQYSSIEEYPGHQVELEDQDGFQAADASAGGSHQTLSFSWE